MKAAMQDDALTLALGILQEAHGRNPQADSFDRDDIRRQLEAVRRSCDASDQAKARLGKAADRRGHFEALATALRRANALLANETRGHQLRDAWKQGGATVRLTDAIAVITALEEAAKRAAEKNRGKRGAHGATEAKAIPPYAIDLLGLVYRNATMSEPRTSIEGPFHLFVCAALGAFGYAVSSDHVRRLIRQACKRPARRSAG